MNKRGSLLVLGSIVVSLVASAGCSADEPAQPAPPPPGVVIVKASDETHDAVGIRNWGVMPTDQGAGPVVVGYDDKNETVVEIAQQAEENDEMQQLRFIVHHADHTASMTFAFVNPPRGSDEPPKWTKSQDDLSDDTESTRFVDLMSKDLEPETFTVGDRGNAGGSAPSLIGTKVTVGIAPQGLCNPFDKNCLSGLKKDAGDLIHKAKCNIVEPVKCGKGLIKVAKGGWELIKNCRGVLAAEEGGAVCSGLTGAETAGVGAAVCEAGAQGVAVYEGYKCIKGGYDLYNGAKDSSENCPKTDDCK